MAENGNDNETKERILNFALLIQQKIDSKGISYSITSQNQGIQDSEVLLIVESWLEKVKDNFKGNIKNSIMLGDGKPPEKKDN